MEDFNTCNSLADDFIICGYSTDVDYENGDIGYKALAYAQGFVTSAGVPKVKPVLEQFDQLGKSDLQIIPEKVKTLAREVAEAANGNDGIPLKLKLSLDLCKYICHIKSHIMSLIIVDGFAYYTKCNIIVVEKLERTNLTVTRVLVPYGDKSNAIWLVFLLLHGQLFALEEKHHLGGNEGSVALIRGVVQCLGTENKVIFI